MNMTEIEAIYSEQYDLLLAFVGRHCLNLCDAEDIVESAFVALMNATDVKHPKAYLYQTAFNIICKEARNKSKYIHIESTHPIYSDIDTPDEADHRSEEHTSELQSR